MGGEVADVRFGVGVEALGDGGDDGEVGLAAFAAQVGVPVDAADAQAAVIFGGDEAVTVDTEAAQPDPAGLAG